MKWEEYVRASEQMLGSNKFSSKIRVGRVIPNDGRWYSFDYEREQRKLRLRDITEEIHSILEWREVFSPREKRKKMLKRRCGSMMVTISYSSRRSGKCPRSNTDSR